MDFQKMVRQFRENVVDENKPQPINEMASKYYRAAAEERVGDLEDGTADIPLAWGSLFPEAVEGTNKPIGRHFGEQGKIESKAAPDDIR